MQIIKYGYITPLPVRCPRCGASVGVEPTDMKKFYYDLAAIKTDGVIDDFKNFFVVNCCMCGKGIKIGVSTIPKPWRDLQCLPGEYRYYIDKFYSKEESES